MLLKSLGTKREVVFLFVRKSGGVGKFTQMNTAEVTL
jgi:hypothetical protein